MPLADFAALKTALASAVSVYFTKNAMTTVAGALESMWTTAPFAGVAPSTAATCNRTTVGNLWQAPEPAGAFANALYPIIAEAQALGTSSGWASLLICDRLSHQGGLSGTVGASEQTTNLPTAALPRYTDGVGVLAALEWYIATGSTAVTATARYTNQGGGGLRTSKTVNLAASRPADTFIILPLQDGDTGVRSVEGVTLSASTLTAGNFGVTLFRPLAMIPVVTPNQNHRNYFFTAAMDEWHDDACLFALQMSATIGTGLPALTARVDLLEVA